MLTATVCCPELYGKSLTYTDESIQLTQSQSDSSWTITLATGGTINLDSDFQTGDFGINLVTPPAYPSISRHIVGDLAPIDFDPVTPGVQSLKDELGNVITDPNSPEPFREDILYDTVGNDHIESGDGNDLIRAYKGGDDILQGGWGRDGITSANQSGAASDKDILEGGQGGDILFSGPDDDKLFAESIGEMDDLIEAGEIATGMDQQGDLLSGGDGNDFLYGSDSKDALFGGNGSDLLVGGGGDDIIMGSVNATAATFDWTYTIETTLGENGGTVYKPLFTNVYYEPMATEDDGNDVVYAGSGNDFVHTGNAEDEVYGGAGNDTIFAWGGDDFIEGGSGDDYLDGDNAVTQLAADKHGDDYIDGGDGDDTIAGRGGSDDLFGGTGDDHIYGDSPDIEIALQQSDYIDGEDGDDYIDGMGGDDTLFGGDGNDTIYGSEGNDLIYGEAGVNILRGEDGDDYIDGSDGRNTILGGLGSDQIHGGDLGDWLQGDEGNDYVEGGLASDTIVGSAGNDQIHGNDGDDQLHGDADGIALVDQGNDYIDGGAGNDLIKGYGGDDSLYGSAGNDSLFGGKGADLLKGGDGNDTYYYNLGDGIDVISDSSSAAQLNSIVFGEGITVGNTSLTAGTDRLIINVGTSSTDRLELLSFNPSNWFGPRAIGTFTFGDGMSMTYDNFIALKTKISGTVDGELLMGNEDANNFEGSAGNDTLYGFGNSDILNGGEGVDLMYGGTGDDKYIVDDPGDVVTELADEGNDTVESSISYTLGDNVENLTLTGTAAAGTGNDLDNVMAGNNLANQLTGGLGDDTLIGGYGDTLIGGLGDDIYTVNDNSLTIVELADEGYDVVQSMHSFALGDNLEELVLTGDYSANGWGNTLDNYLSGNDAANALYGLEGNDTINGGAGNDSLVGGLGNDTYYWDEWYGNDAIVEAGGEDTLESYVYSSDLEFSLIRTNGTWVTGINIENTNTGEMLSLKDWFNGSDNKIEHFRFADIDLTGSEVEQMVLASGIYGTENDDYMSGLDGYGMTMDGLAGNDTLNGGSLGDTLYGGEGNDRLYGNAGDDSLVGGAGDDTIQGGAGNDIYTWGAGMGNDIIREERGTDTLVLDALASTDIEFSISGNQGDNGILATIKATGETLRFQNWFRTDEWGSGEDYKIETFRFADGDLTAAQVQALAVERGIIATNGNNNIYGPDDFPTRIDGGAGDDFISGGASDDTIQGGAGNDMISDYRGNNVIDGGPGNDTINTRSSNNLINWSPGMGNETITRYTYNECESGFNTYNLSALRLTDLSCSVIMGGDPFNSDAGIIMTVAATGEELRFIRDYGGISIDRFIFADGEVPGSEILEKALSQGAYGTQTGDTIHMPGYYSTTAYGLAGNDTIYAGAVGGTIHGGDGDDYIQGYPFSATGGGKVYAEYSGNDTLLGDAGNDTLIGSVGADLLDGGNGDDIMLGGAWDDTYVVDSAGDVVTELAREGTDTVEASISYALTANVENLTLTGTSDIAGTGNALHNVLTGNSGSNVLSGGAGNDTVIGGAGNDSYVWGTGLGNDVVHDVSGTDTIVLTGVNSGDVSFLVAPDRNDEGILVRINSTGETLLVKAWFTDETNRVENFQFADRLVTASEIETIVTAGWIKGTDTGESISVPAGQTSIVNGMAGNDTLTGADMADIIFGQEGDDFIDGGAGDDYISAGSGNDVATGGAGNDTIKGGCGDDSLSGGDGDDTLIDDLGTGVLSGDGGNDTIMSGNGNDIIWGGDGNDYVTAGDGNNMVFGELGDDNLYAGNGDDYVDGGVGNDCIGGMFGSDTLIGGTGNDTIYGDIDDPFALSQVNDDSIEGGDGNDELYGMTGSDTLWGNDGDDYLDGGDGNDVMYGGMGNDTYIGTRWHVMSRDIIHDDGGYDTLSLEDGFSSTMPRSSIAFSADGEDLRLTNKITGSIIRIEDWFAGADHRIERFVYDYDYELSAAQVESLVTVGWFLGGDGNDALYGPQEPSWLAGGGGDDTIYSGNTSDTIYGGDGNDYIFGSSAVSGVGGQGQTYGGNGNDFIVLGPYNIADGGMGSDLYSYYRVTGEAVLAWREIRGMSNARLYSPMLMAAAEETETDTLLFGEGIEEQNLSLTANTDGLIINTGDEGDRVILRGFNLQDAYTASAVDVIRFASGEELTYAQLLDLGINFYGSENADTMAGTNAPDRIHALGGDDTITGGLSNDTLEGAAGSDTYVFGLGDGTDTIIDTSIPGEGNTILFGEGITLNDLRAQLDGTTLTLEYGTFGDALKLVNFDRENLNGSHVVETVRFYDGSQIDILSLIDPGTEGNDMIVTGAMNDVINAKGGDDYVSTNAGNDTVDGGAGNDTIFGGAGDDVLTGATGDDVLDGGDGNDTYIYNAADGMDIITDASGSDMVVLGEGYTKNNVDYRLDGNTIRVRSIDSEGAVSADGLDIATDAVGRPVVETLCFADGSEIDLAGAFDPQNIAIGTDGSDVIMRGGASDMVYTGSGMDFVMAGAGDDRIYGGRDADILFGEGGNDAIFGEEGADVIFGGTGSDTLSGGAAADLLFGNEGADMMYGAEGSDVLWGGDGDDGLYGGAESDMLYGDNGNDLLSGGTGGDLLSGGAGNDSLHGGSGNDDLHGGSGNDTYIFSVNDGDDSITDQGSDATTSDRVLFTADVAAETIALFKQGHNLIVGYGTNDSVTVTNQALTNHGVEKLELNSGLFLNNADINTVIQQITAFASANGISLTSINDVRNNQDLMTIISNSWHA